MDEHKFSRHEYLIMVSVEAAASSGQDVLRHARQAMDSQLDQHPEWDLAEVRTLDQWRMRGL